MHLEEREIYVKCITVFGRFGPRFERAFAGELEVVGCRAGRAQMMSVFDQSLPMQCPLTARPVEFGSQVRALERFWLSEQAAHGRRTWT